MLFAHHLRKKMTQVSSKWRREGFESFFVKPDKKSKETAKLVNISPYEL